jgi:hypothetical protein
MTQKIVINTCYGGYGLSEEAVLLIAKEKGLTLYAEPSHFGLGIVNYFTVPKEARVKDADATQWREMSMVERQAHNAAYDAQTFNADSIKRDDPLLIKAVETLGAKAAGNYAELKIVEIPDGVDWEISEYDGKEHVAQKHSTWY